MGLLTPEFRIELDEKKPFCPGDFITGTLILSNTSEIKAQNIDVMLRCTEYLHTNYFTGFALTLRWKEVFNRNRAYSYRKTVFPPGVEKSGTEAPVFWGNGQWKPHNTWTDDFTDIFTIKPGTHAFKFELQVPPGLPPSLHASFSNNIQWKVCAKLFKGTSLALALEAEEVVEVRNNEAVILSSDDIEKTAEPKPVVVYQHGVKQESIAKLCVDIPRAGLVQAPSSMNIVLGMQGEAVDDLVLTHVELELKRKVVTTVIPLSRMKKRRRWQERHDTFRHNDVIYSRDLDMPCSEGFASVNDDLHKAQIEVEAVESFESKCFSLTYKLAVSVVVYPRGKPSEKRKLRVSIPVKVNSTFAEVRRLFVPADRVSYQDLPMYKA